VLVLGASGQLGGEFARALAARGVRHRLAARSPGPGALALDMARPETLAALVARVAPAVVINAAAYTAVDRAETEAALAQAVNAQAPASLAAACREQGAILVHFSTDYVFDGTLDRPYAEDDAPAPLGVYGRTKLRGEEAVRASGAAHLVLRTSWLYTPGGRNFVATMLRLFRGEAVVRVVDDQWGCPTWARPLALAVLDLLGREEAPGLRALGGLYHLCSRGETSWHGFAAAVRDLMQPPAGVRLEAIGTAEFAAPAPRPARSVLDCRRAAERLGIRLPAWREQLVAAMPEFLALGER
jgi:dTDP-4-dehydrorhamnose reductase